MSLFFSARAARRIAPVFLAVLLALQSSIGDGLAVTAPTAASSPAAPEARVGASAAPTGQRLERALAATLVRARRDSGAPGLSMAIVADDGRLWDGASGTDRQGRKLAPSDPQTMASITKAFTATLVMQLVDEGKIRLGAPANRYLPKVRLLRQVTVRQLLNHTSGIADLYGPLKGTLDQRPGTALGSNDVLRPIPKGRFAPGRGYAYSNTNFYLLGHIIESVTGRPFEKVLKERITGPLGLDHTRLLTAADRQLPAAWSTAFWTSGAMVAPPAELATFGHALYGGGLVSKRSRTHMTDFRAGHAYGLGTQLLRIGSRYVPGHSGLLYATTSLLVHLPEERVTIAMYGTKPHTDLETALVGRHGRHSLLELALQFGR